MLNIGNSTRFRLGDKVTVIVEDACSFPKGHKGVITEIREDIDNNMLYKVDEGYEYSEEELELTMNSMKFKIGDTVEVISGVHKGSIGNIIETDKEDNNLPYYVRGISWFSESELTLKSKNESKMDFEISIPNEIPKSNLESKVEINVPNENPIVNSEMTLDFKIDNAVQCTTIASLESELLGLYRELHRQNKDSQN